MFPQVRRLLCDTCTVYAWAKLEKYRANNYDLLSYITHAGIAL